MLPMIRGTVPAIAACIAAGLAAGFSPGIAGATDQTFSLVPGTGVVGSLTTVQSRYEDTLLDIGRANGLGYEELTLANPGVDPWLPGDGTEVLLPRKYVLPDAPRQGLVVNIAEFRMYYYTGKATGTGTAGGAGPASVTTFPISIGRMDWSTPIGRWHITGKQKDPAWYPPESIRAEHLADGRGYLPRVVPPGPDNPLGRYAMRLNLGSYLIHGTNRPSGVGMQVTHGCIRMYPEDIEWLFPKVPVSTPVTIVNQPYKFGWHGDELYLEVHPPLEGDNVTLDKAMTALMEQYVAATRDRPARVDWSLVDEVYQRRNGIPVRVGRAETVSAVVDSGDRPPEP
jgi:L,D-transpeptidase ErfK/SrfK